jgi:hypothetical protein
MNPGKIGQIGRGLAEITAMEGNHGGKPMVGNPWRETMEGNHGGRPGEKNTKPFFLMFVFFSFN